MPDVCGLFNETDMEFLVYFCIFKTKLKKLKTVSDSLKKKKKKEKRDCDIGYSYIIRESTCNHLKKKRISMMALKTFGTRLVH